MHPFPTGGMSQSHHETRAQTHVQSLANRSHQDHPREATEYSEDKLESKYTVKGR